MAAERLKRQGPNVLPHAPPPTIWAILLRQFRNPLIYILAVAAVIALAMGEVIDAAFIAVVLALNAAVGGYQEWRAEQSTRALQQLLKIRAAVLRNGEQEDIDAEELVPGDVVLLESGNRVPADLRLLTTSSLEVDESLLTGESLSVQKDPDWTGKPDSPVSDRHNMAHAASVVARGRGKGVVVATGADTAVGQLALDVMTSAGGQPPLVERMERFTRAIAKAILASSLVIAVLGVFLRGYGVQEMFFFVVAMAVSAIPEGLPVAMSVALAIGTTRMAGRGVIVRRLAAVEGLGSCTMIASDKTGTLTCNELTVREVRLLNGRVYEIEGAGFIPEGAVRFDGKTVEAADDPDLKALIRAAVLCNEGELHQREGEWVWHGDPTDIAMLAFGRKLGIERSVLLKEHPQTHEIPFESEHQYAATYHDAKDGAIVMVKGAPERVLAMCRWQNGENRKDEFAAVAEKMAKIGYRVIALADGSGTFPNDGAEPSGLRFLGFVGMIDPLRPGVREAVDACRTSGITVCMITGDHPATALAIARDLNFADNASQVITGGELAEKSPDELEEIVRNTRVFARVAPRQKLEIVEAARNNGHFVAVTGDGVNDAPALRASHIGIAMGKAGTDVAREAAELVLTDDNFATIVAGIEEGRVAYRNVRNVIYLLVSCGAAEVLMLGAAILIGMPLPLLPTQILWLNLVTNGIQGVALAFERKEGDELRHKPRPPSEPIFNRLMIERTIVGAAVMAGVWLLAFDWMLKQGMSVESSRNALLLLMVLFQNFHVGNSRSETKSLFQISPMRNPLLLIGTAMAQLLHIAALYIPFTQTVLRTEPVTLSMWLTLLGLASSILITIELHKFIWRRRHGAQHG